jgi:hypothetical protein
MVDDLPVHVSHYLQDLDPEGGQAVMRLFIDLPLKYASHGERSKGLQSGELGGQISCDQWFSMLAFSQFWVILAEWARKAFSTPAKSFELCRHILLLKMVCLHYVILEMGSFLTSVANNFCDQPLSKYLESKTVLIYCPQTVVPERGEHLSSFWSKIH